jgi:serine/threonine protein kinase
MSKSLRNEYFGPYKLIRAIGAAHGADRFVVLCNKTDTNFMLYRFEQLTNAKLRRQIFDRLIHMSTLQHPHLLKINSVSYDDHGRLCVITPYTGNHDGIVTLENLLDHQEGKLGSIEALRATEHLLEACDFAHQNNLINGPIHTSDVLVDRFGCLQVQLYSYGSIQDPHQTQSFTRGSLIADEIRSVIELGYTMLTGLSSQAELINPTRVIKKLDRNWDTWFEIGLDPIDGFESFQHALNALPTNDDCTKHLSIKQSRLPQVHIGSMLRRFKTTQPPASSQRI